MIGGGQHIADEREIRGKADPDPDAEKEPEEDEHRSGRAERQPQQRESHQRRRGRGEPHARDARDQPETDRADEHRRGGVGDHKIRDGDRPRVRERGHGDRHRVGQRHRGGGKEQHLDPLDLKEIGITPPTLLNLAGIAEVLHKAAHRRAGQRRQRGKPDIKLVEIMMQQPFAHGNDRRQRQHRAGGKEREADAARPLVQQYRLRRHRRHHKDADADAEHRAEKEQQKRAVQREGDPRRHRDAEKRTADQRTPNIEPLHHHAAEGTAEQHDHIKDTQKKPYGLGRGPHPLIKGAEQEINIRDAGDAVICQENQKYLAVVLHILSSCLQKRRPPQEGA